MLMAIKMHIVLIFFSPYQSSGVKRYLFSKDERYRRWAQDALINHFKVLKNFFTHATSTLLQFCYHILWLKYYSRVGVCLLNRQQGRGWRAVSYSYLIFPNCITCSWAPECWADLPMETLQQRNCTFVWEQRNCTFPLGQKYAPPPK